MKTQGENTRKSPKEGPLMLQSPTRKNRINLADYDYEKDLKNRLLMSKFTSFDVEVLEEILLNSLVIDLPKLAAELAADLPAVEETIEKLIEVGLVTRTTYHRLEVDKEMRRYYEFQILKFDDEFEADLDFLQGLLKQVPIHLLPIWYAIPRTSTNIFQSIVERYLRTPRLYQRYLLELNFEDSILVNIMQDVFNSPDQKLYAEELRNKYGLSEVEFALCILHLEFNFVCCLSYNRVNGEWKEVVTPFHEWREYVRFQRNNQPKPLKHEEPISPLCFQEMTFAADVKKLLEELHAQALSVERSEDGRYRFPRGLPTHMANRKNQVKNPELWETYFNWIIEKALRLGLAKIEKNQLGPEGSAKEWLGLSLEDQALALYRHPRNTILSASVEEALSNERNLRELEKYLAKFSESGWILFDDFCQGLSGCFHCHGEVTLQREKGKWRYSRPTYSAEETAFVHAAIFERFFEAGFVETGCWQGRECFRVTAFGRAILC